MHIFANSGAEKHGLPERDIVVGNVSSDKRKGALINANNRHARCSVRSNGCWMLCASR